MLGFLRVFLAGGLIGGIAVSLIYSRRERARRNRRLSSRARRLGLAAGRSVQRWSSQVLPAARSTARAATSAARLARQRLKGE